MAGEIPSLTLWASSPAGAALTGFDVPICDDAVNAKPLVALSTSLEVLCMVQEGNRRRPYRSSGKTNRIYTSTTLAVFPGLTVASLVQPEHVVYAIIYIRSSSASLKSS